MPTACRLAIPVRIEAICDYYEKHFVSVGDIEFGATNIIYVPGVTPEAVF